MPRYKGKKPIFNYKDTWNLYSHLSPFICEGVKKFKEVIVNREKEGKCFGIPGYIHDESLGDEGSGKWLEILDKIIYAFGDNEPDIMSYNFDFRWVDENGNKILLDDVKANVGYYMEATNKGEYQRYDDDVKEHQLKAQEGYDLFAKHFKDLWW